jgi:hypothetical protein
MHLDGNIGYTTIHPLFVRILIKSLKDNDGQVFVTDLFLQGDNNFGVRDAKSRGCTEEVFSAPIYPAAGVFNKYFYSKKVDFKTLKEIQVAGHIHDIEVLINLSHFKGPGVCAYGGACKNIAMGCVTQKNKRRHSCS